MLFRCHWPTIFVSLTITAFSVATVESCVCKPTITGCVILTKASPKKACECGGKNELTFRWFGMSLGTCEGKETDCQNKINCKGTFHFLNSNFCALDDETISERCEKPDTSYDSCLMSGDDGCGGYTKEERLQNKCNCDYVKEKGCKISKALPGYYCKCNLVPTVNKILTICTGTKVKCHGTNNTDDYLCKNPGKTYLDCAKGEGNCNGYPPEYGVDCKCRNNFPNRGCIISQAASPGNACQCDLDDKNAEKCVGSIKQCSQDEDSKCKDPDTSFKSCLLGGGNCEGYPSEYSRPETSGCNCDYNTKNEGCVIDKPSPPGSYCKCYLTTPNKQTKKCIGITFNCSNTDDKNDYLCKNPGKTYLDCAKGKGNCNGYPPEYGVGCKCRNNFPNRGCIISQAASRPMACFCSIYDINNAYFCFGDEKYCFDNNPKCKNPDTSFESCRVAGGNCEGYPSEYYNVTTSGCKCEYNVENKGCTITKKAPVHSFCACILLNVDEMSVKCRGKNVRCHDNSSMTPEEESLCSNPGVTHKDCMAGKGNCDGYGIKQSD